MIGLPGPTLDREAAALLDEICPAAVILFRRNCKRTQQVRELTDAIRTRLGVDTLVAIDEEGGRVSRLDAFCTATPAAADLAASADPLHPVQAATITAQRLRLLGIDFNLAPVLDLARPGANLNNALSGRCWGTNSEEVLMSAGPWLETFKKEKILTCAKHFPGAGPARSDPHLNLPQVTASVTELEADLLPFSALLDRLDAVMTGHLHYLAHSGRTPTPASLEPAIQTALLRDRLGFRGCVLSDDLEMEAVVGTHGIGEATRRAVKAGTDLPLVCHSSEHMRRAASALRELVDPPRLHDARLAVEALQNQPRALDAFDAARWERLEDLARQLVAEVGGEAGQHSSPVQDY